MLIKTLCVLFILQGSACNATTMLLNPVQTDEASATLFATSVGDQEKPRVKVNLSENGKAYYHLTFTLTPDNLMSLDHFTTQQFIENGGQFELSVNRSAFPVSAPHCHGDIIVRMPWVPSTVDVSKKYQLYQKILAIADSKQGEINLAIELNPYVEKTNEGLQLQHCNVFFRHANHQYIPHIQALN